jgi:hypothetical protein
MYLKYLFYTSLLLLSAISYSQNNDRWVAGSSKQLKGKVINYILFISTPEKVWTDNLKSDFLLKLEKANAWIEDQASKYEVTLEIHNVSEQTDIILDSIEQGKGSGNERVDWASYLLNTIGISNPAKKARKLKKRFNASNIQLVIVASSNGRPYSMRYAKGMKKRKYFFESLILYPNYNNGAPIPIDAVFSHELLHLYGAWDLYSTYAQTDDRQSMASELYPNDIMHRVDHNIYSLEIDSLTAYLIGWSKEKPEIFEWFRPGDFRK